MKFAQNAIEAGVVLFAISTYVKMVKTEIEIIRNAPEKSSLTGIYMGSRGVASTLKDSLKESPVRVLAEESKR